MLKGIGIDPHSGPKQNEAIYPAHHYRQDSSGGSELLSPYSIISQDGYHRDNDSACSANTSMLS
jgi:hypothetical protein